MVELRSEESRVTGSSPVLSKKENMNDKLPGTIRCCPRCKYMYNSKPKPTYFGQGLLQSFLDDLNKNNDKYSNSQKVIEVKNEFC